MDISITNSYITIIFFKNKIIKKDHTLLSIYVSYLFFTYYVILPSLLQFIFCSMTVEKEHKPTIFQWTIWTACSDVQEDKDLKL